jgi:hypothetical protein
MIHLFALLKDKKIIGLFDKKENIENMLEGLVKNNFCKKSQLSIVCFIKNSIYKIEDYDNEENDDILTEESEDTLTPEEKKKIIEEKSKLEYEMNLLKKKKEQIEESKKTFKVDLELYQKFKKILLDNNNFEIPELFQNKFNVFKLLDDENKLDWENFYANYEPDSINTGYNQMFSGQSAREDLFSNK